MIPDYVKCWCRHVAQASDLGALQSYCEEILEERRSMVELDEKTQEEIRGLKRIRAVQHVRTKFRIPLAQALDIVKKYEQN